MCDCGNGGSNCGCRNNSIDIEVIVDNVMTVKIVVMAVISDVWNSGYGGDVDGERSGDSVCVFWWQ